MISPAFLAEIQALKKPVKIEPEIVIPPGFVIRQRGPGIYVYRKDELLRIVQTMDEVRATIEGSLLSTTVRVEIRTHGKDRWRLFRNGRLCYTGPSLDAVIKKARAIA